MEKIHFSPHFLVYRTDGQGGGGHLGNTPEYPLLRPLASSLWFVHPGILKAEQTLEFCGLSFSPALK